MKPIVDLAKGIPILEVAGRLGLKIRGTKMHCFNASHEDRKSPSLSFNVRENYFHCFGCGIGGSPIELVMSFLGYGRRDAIRWLAREFGLSRQTSRRLRVVRSAPKPRVPVADRTVAANVPDSEIYEWVLRNAELPPEAREYLLSRGLSEKTSKHFRLAGTLNGRGLIHAAETHFGRERTLRAGLLARGKGTGKLYPVWWEAVVLIPFFSRDMMPIYLQARCLCAETGRKYVGLAGISKPLFNIQELAELKAGERVFLVEGAMDVMAAYEVGLRAIGILGAETPFKRSWAEALREFQVAIIPDRDAAGTRLKDAVVSAFAAIGKSIRVRNLPPEYKDLTEALEAIKRGDL